jgi:dihydrofolate synthase/folylpolyglutamate synthase
MALGLDRTREACRALGDPQDALRTLHVAGTNGKGSVSAMLEAIARASGLRVGLYTSPHLSRFAERIQLGGAPIDDVAFASALGRVLADAPDDLTFFETLTLSAFVAFREASVDVAVLEVGLGGRLDSTNVVPPPLATCVTSITEGLGGRYLEHGALLGDTPAAIAREKAGIFKPGVPAVLGPLGAAAHAACVEVAREVGAPVWAIELDRDRSTVANEGVARVDAAWRDGRVHVELADRAGEAPARYVARPPLPGAHQRANAAVALAMAHLARGPLGLSREAIARGLESARWPGRLERVERGGIDVWLDCAHNLEGTRALVEALPELGLAPSHTVLVYGALADKAFEPSLALLAPHARDRIYASPEGRAPAPLEALRAIAEGEAVGDPVRAIERALASARPGDAVVVTGSLYLVGAIRAHLLGVAPDPVIAL